MQVLPVVSMMHPYGLDIQSSLSVQVGWHCSLHLPGACKGSCERSCERAVLSCCWSMCAFGSPASWIPAGFGFCRHLSCVCFRGDSKKRGLSWCRPSSIRLKMKFDIWLCQFTASQTWLWLQPQTNHRSQIRSGLKCTQWHKPAAETAAVKHRHHAFGYSV